MLTALRNDQRVDRPPIWIMRQAGRYLPEYRALKEQHDFVTMVRTPELAAEVTLQPIKRFDFDAAVIFSDILIVPEAMGQPYRFREEGGIAMEFPVQDIAAISRLDGSSVPQKLAYLGDALRRVRETIPEKALLGFAGSPWTLAGYMVEGGSSEGFPTLKAMAINAPEVFFALMDRLTDAVAACVALQIEAGADAIQLFDTWGGTCPGHHYPEFSLMWIRRIITAFPGTPFILYARGVGQHLHGMAATGARCLSLDHGIDLGRARKQLPAEIALQGNLDPVLLSGDPGTVVRETQILLESMKGVNNHIVNLGHGILPTAKIESVEAFVETARGYQPIID